MKTWPVRFGPKRPLIERFWEKVDKSGDCWIWTGARNQRGYGVIQVSGKPLYAHRVSLELDSRPVPLGALVCHHCDNPPCVRPSHLYVGTASTNAQDAVARGRLRPHQPDPEVTRAFMLNYWREHRSEHPELQKTHCPQGHPYTPENTYVRKNGSRHCRICTLTRNADWQRRCRVYRHRDRRKTA